MFNTKLKKDRWKSIPPHDGVFLSTVKIVNNVVYLTIIYDKFANGGIAQLFFNNEKICDYICEDGLWFIENRNNDPKFTSWVQTAHVGIFELCN